jgi:hypothetical protein
MQDDAVGSNLCRQGLRGGIDMHEDGTVVVCWKEGYATVWDLKTATPQFVLTSGFSVDHTGNSSHALALISNLDQGIEQSTILSSTQELTA